MAKKTNICNTDCSKTFAEQFQDLLADVCFLANTSGVSGDLADRRVSVSPSDPTSGTLIDKLQGVSGINFTIETGVSGQVYIASLDLNFLDNRYSNQTENVLTFPLNGGTHNGNVFPNFCLDFESLRYPDDVKSISTWNTVIPKDFFPGPTSLNIKWTQSESVSGIVIFDIKYNSVGVGDILSLSNQEIVSGFSDGISLKLYETKIDIVSGFIAKEDTFLLKIIRRGDLPQDDLNAPIELISVSLNYTEF